MGFIIEEIKGRGVFHDEDELTKEDIAWLKEQAIPSTRLDIYKELDANQRRNIMRKHNKGWDAGQISIYYNLKYSLIKEYLLITLDKYRTDGKRLCIQCLDEKKLSEFWKHKGNYTARCADCLNANRNHKREADPEYRTRVNKLKRESFHRNKRSYADRINTPEKHEHVKKQKRDMYHASVKKKMNDKILKNRLLNNNKLGQEKMN